mgnify:CR=1 FL=1
MGALGSLVFLFAVFAVSIPVQLGLLALFFGGAILQTVAAGIACLPLVYAGALVEEAPVGALFEDPRHPYTQALLETMPSVEGDRAERLTTIPGSVPSAADMPAGCRFAARCPFATAKCAEDPPMTELAPGHRVACWHAPVEDAALPEARIA